MCPGIGALLSSTPVLPAFLIRQEVERRFFSLLRSRLIVFEKPNQQNQEKCCGGYFRRDNRDQLVPGFQTGPRSTSTGAEWPCTRSVLVIITSVTSENKLVGSKRNPRKQTSSPEHEKKKPVNMVTFPATLKTESPQDWPKTTVWPWCKRCDEIPRCRIVRFWYSVTGPLVRPIDHLLKHPFEWVSPVLSCSPFNWSERGPSLHTPSQMASRSMCQQPSANRERFPGNLKRAQPWSNLVRKARGCKVTLWAYFGQAPFSQRKKKRK